jgi:hypothetical protein
VVKKPIQKSLLLFVIALILFGVFPVIGIRKIGPKTAQAAECQVTPSTAYTAKNVFPDKKRVGKNEPFGVYSYFELNSTFLSQCATEGGKDSHVITYIITKSAGGGIRGGGFGNCAFNPNYSYQKTYQAFFYDKGFRNRITGATLSGFLKEITASAGIGAHCIDAYLHHKDKPYDQGLSFRYGEYITGLDTAGNATIDPNFPTDDESREFTKLFTETIVDNTVSISYKDIKTKIVSNANGAGLRERYRVLWSEDLRFGVNPGLDGVHMEWDGKQVGRDQSFKLPAKDDNWGSSTDPKYAGSTVFFGYYDILSKTPDIACQTTTTSTECKQVVFRRSDNSPNGEGSEKMPVIPGDYEPVLFKNAWQSMTSTGKIVAPTTQQLQNGNGGKALGSVDFAAIPAIVGSRNPVTHPLIAVLSDYGIIVLSGGGTLKKVTVEVFATNNDIIAACKADPATDKARCDDLRYAKYQFASTVSQTTNPTEAEAPSVSQSLYAFIVRVISDIIIWLQSVIYWVFATIVVPVLVALLRVRPYQDIFVNMIYPGWLILRNLANIFFIVSLLVVGLRILFQQSAASTARGFILRLVVMALLVNFSLVIAQGIVGIADTVQAQFLPANSKVIEALGQKLMVEPLKIFREEVVGASGTFNTTDSDLALADTVKPLVLLILTVAAFWSFVAVAAFLAVRLVALWVLYMLSPLAYVGYVMDETKQYAKKWWSEFIKYAMLTPVLVFFLNIAALMATLFAGSNNTLFDFSNNSLAGDAVAGSLTIATHFIVLVFIFAGMKFALSSGTFGAKTIVDYAQKGFKNTLTKWPLAGKDVASDYASRGLERLGFNKAAKGLSVATHPLQFGQAVKKKWIDDAGEARRDREAERIGSIPFLTKSDKKSDILRKFKEKAGKDYSDEDSAALEGILESNIRKGKSVEAGGALYQLAKDGDFDEIVRAAGKANNKTYSQDASGLNAAMNDLQKKLGWSNTEREAFKKFTNKQAKKDKKKNHYADGVIYDSAQNKYRELAVDPATNQFAGNDYAQWVEKQVKSRLDKTPVEDMKETNINSMLREIGRDPNNNPLHDFTETQLGVLSQIPLAAIDNRDTMEKFRAASPGKFATVSAAYQRSGRAALEAHLQGQGWAPGEVQARMDVMDRLYTLPQPGQGGGGGNRPRNPIGFGPTVVIPGGGANPTTPTARQSNQMDAAQNINNAVRFQSGGNDNVIDVNAKVSDSPTPLTKGFADSTVGPEESKPGQETAPKKVIQGFARGARKVADAATKAKDKINDSLNPAPISIKKLMEEETPEDKPKDEPKDKPENPTT